MIERLARIIDPEAWASLTNGLDGPDTLWGVRRGFSITKAVEVLRALGDPPPEVVRAVAQRAWHSGSGIDPATVWQAGVAAALRPLSVNAGEVVQ